MNNCTIVEGCVVCSCFISSAVGEVDIHSLYFLFLSLHFLICVLATLYHRNLLHFILPSSSHKKKDTLTKIQNAAVEPKTKTHRMPKFSTRSPFLNLVLAVVINLVLFGVCQRYWSVGNHLPLIQEQQLQQNQILEQQELFSKEQKMSFEEAQKASSPRPLSSFQVNTLAFHLCHILGLLSLPPKLIPENPPLGPRERSRDP
jgi:hypothetical protein